MLKSSNAMKERSFEPQFESVLKNLVALVPFLRLESFSSGAELLPDRPHRPDWLAEICAGNQRWNLVLVGKRSGQPRMIRNGVLQLESYLRQLPKEGLRYGMLLAPFISSKSASICTEAGMGYADLSGNVHMSFGHMFIDVRTAENPFREKRELRSVFTPKAGRILRVLLTPPLRAWKVEELAKETGVSLGHVSNVRRRLLDREWAQVDVLGLRLTRPEELARAWQVAYKPRPRKRATYYSVLHGEEMETAFRAALAEVRAGEHIVLASFSAARWIAPYARHATHFFYADAIGTEVLQRHLQLQSATQGENVVVEEPREDDVFIRRLEPESGIWCSGLVQTWLDLGATGERGREAAEHLLQHELLPEWKEIA